MPLTYVHLMFNISIYFILSLFLPIEFKIINCVLLALAELIDLDHLWSYPKYKKDRNSLKTHFLHKRWFIIIPISTVLLFFYPLTFIGIGLLSHLLLDWLYVELILKKKINKKMKK